MNWTVQDLGALGELLGSIAVLCTLVYLALQARATRSAMELQTMMAAIIPSMEINNTVLGSSQECADALFKAFDGEDLSDKELYFYTMFIANHLMALATVFMSPSAPPYSGISRSSKTGEVTHKRIGGSCAGRRYRITSPPATTSFPHTSQFNPNGQRSTTVFGYLSGGSFL